MDVDLNDSLEEETDRNRPATRSSIIDSRNKAQTQVGASPKPSPGSVLKQSIDKSKIESPKIIMIKPVD